MFSVLDIQLRILARWSEFRSAILTVILSFCRIKQAASSETALAIAPYRRRLPKRAPIAPARGKITPRHRRVVIVKGAEGYKVKSQEKVSSIESEEDIRPQGIKSNQISCFFPSWLNQCTLYSYASYVRFSVSSIQIRFSFRT